MRNKLSLLKLKQLLKEAKLQLAEPGHEDFIISNYNYPLYVDSEDLIQIINELIYLRKINKGP